MVKSITFIQVDPLYTFENPPQAHDYGPETEIGIYSNRWLRIIHSPTTIHHQIRTHPPEARGSVDEKRKTIHRIDEYHHTHRGPLPKWMNIIIIRRDPLPTWMDIIIIHPLVALKVQRTEDRHFPGRSRTPCKQVLSCGAQA